MKSSTSEPRRTIHRRFFGSWVADWKLTEEKTIARLGPQPDPDLAGDPLRHILVSFTEDHQIAIRLNGAPAPFSSIQILSTTLNSIYAALIQDGMPPETLRVLFVHQGDDILFRIAFLRQPDGNDRIRPAIYFRRLPDSAVAAPPDCDRQETHTAADIPVPALERR